MLRRSQSIVLILAFFLFSCEKKVSSIEEYKAYIYNPENGLCIEKGIDPITITAVYLPQDFLNLKDEGFAIGPGADNSVNFVLVFKDETGNDLSYYGLSGAEEYADRQYQLNFSLGQALTLHQGDKTLLPKLTHWENTYGLSNNKILQVVFADPELNTKEEMKVQFADPVFQTGISEFVFTKEAVNTLPIVIK